jgi:spore coat protein U-like protein
VGDCTVSAFTLSFGVYEPVVVNAASPLDSSSTINVYCTKGTRGDVSLDNGSNFAAGNRRMKSAAAAFMTYEIYKDAGRATVWNAVNINSATSTSKTLPLGGGFIAYGRIPGGQDLAAGAYNDTLQATVTY